MALFIPAGTNQKENDHAKKMMDSLFNQAGKQAGVSAEQVKQSVNSGDFSTLLRAMKPEDAKRFHQAINNPDLAKQILSSPQAQALLRRFSQGGDQNGGLG